MDTEKLLQALLSIREALDAVRDAIDPTTATTTAVPSYRVLDTEYDCLMSVHPTLRRAQNEAKLLGGAPRFVVSSPSTEPAAHRTPPERFATVFGQIGQMAYAAIREGRSNEEALAYVRQRFPDVATTVACIAWYRNKLRSDGEKVPTAREIKHSRTS